MTHHKPRSPMLAVGERRVRATVFTVGTHFATAARVRVDGREFRSEDRPFGFSAAALESLAASVRRAGYTCEVSP